MSRSALKGRRVWTPTGNGSARSRALILGLFSMAALSPAAAAFLLPGVPIESQATTESAIEDIAGTWQGPLDDLRVVCKISKGADGKYTAVMYSIDQGADPVPVSSVTLQGDRLEMTVAAAHGSYQGKLSADGKTISGVWTQLHSSPLELTRATPETVWIIPPPDPSTPPHWVRLGADGKLVYAKTPRGDRIPDFSSAGYRGGGVALPRVGERVEVSPTGGADDTQAIQAALDKVAMRAPGARGERGAVELTSGTFHLAGTLALHVSGVVLRGSGADGANGTVLEMTGAPHLAIEMKGEFRQRELGVGTWLTDKYVPAGATVIHVANASDIHAGDLIQVVKPVTPQWSQFMGMDHLVRNGKPEKWVQHDIRVRRRVISVLENAVRLQVPLTDSFDAQFYPGILPRVTRVEVDGQIAETGVENLRIVAPDRSINYHEDPRFDGIVMDNIVDSWLRSVAFQDTSDSVRIDYGAERLTAVNVDVEQHATVTSRASPFDFSVDGSQILLDRCTGKGNKVSYVATESHSEGPVVVLHCRFSGDGLLEGHQRWSTGLLVDGCAVPDGSVNLRNRGEMGTGHGWAIGWSVLWNTEAGRSVVQDPPGDLNWSIGDMGEQLRGPMPVIPGPPGAPLPSGVIESQGKHVTPESLYLQQLRERMGAPAVGAIGYR